MGVQVGFLAIGVVKSGIMFELFLCLAFASLVSLFWMAEISEMITIQKETPFNF